MHLSVLGNIKKDKVVSRITAVAVISLLLTSVLPMRPAQAAVPLTYSSLGTHPQATAQPTTYGKTLHSLEFLDGNLYAGYGSAAADDGPIDINPFNITSGTFTGSVLSVPTEEISRMRVIGGKLYAPMIDPDCGLVCPAGFAVGSPWSLEQPLTDVVHIFDMGTLNGTDRWAVGSAEDVVSGGHVWRSANGTNGWQVVQTDTSTPTVNGLELYRWIATLNGRIYTQASNVSPAAPVRIFDGTTWTAGTTTEVAGSNSKVLTFANRIVTTKDGLSSYDGTTVTDVTSFTGEVADMYIDGSYMYILRTNGTLVRTQDLSTWQELGPTTPGASSVAVSNGRIYIGTTQAKIFGSNEPIPTTSYVATPDSSYLLGGDFPPSYISQFGSAGTSTYRADDIAYDSAGNWYAVHSSARTIRKFDSNNNFLTSWGALGSGNGQFSNPTAVTIDASNNVYIVDRNNNRIQKFDSNGTYISQFGTAGSGNGQFSSPTNITIDSNGNIFVADTGNSRIQKFNSSATYLAQWGVEGSGGGEFSFPLGIDTDSSNNVYVVDGDNNRIQKFDNNGGYLTQWGGVEGSGDGEFGYPSRLVVDASNNVYVADSDNYRVQKFDSNGAYLDQWGSNGTGDGEFNNMGAITTDNNGNIIAVNSGSRIQRFNNSGTFINNVIATGLTPGKFTSPGGTATSSDGSLYVADGSNNRIQKFDSAGSYVTQWGSAGTGNGQFDRPENVAVDSSGNVYVTDQNNNRVQKFTSGGTYVSQFGTGGTGNGQFFTPNGIAIDSDDNIYIVDQANSRIQKFNSNANYVSQWGISGAGNSEFDQPNDIAVDSLNNVYVTDSNNKRVQKFDSNGSYLLQWGEEGVGDWQFTYPVGIAVDSQDNVYVTDSSGANRIQKFDNQGRYLTKWGSSGTGNGQFNAPNALSIDASNNFYVTDSSNNRIQKFAYINSASLVSSTGSGAISINTPAGTTISCATSVTAESLASQDAGRTYPLGLVDFCLRVRVGTTQQVTMTFVTDLKPSQVTARKYNPNTKLYSSVPGAAVTETTLDGKHALRLVYDITDGGAIDTDGAANGTILDPVGLALNGTITSDGDLADTGQNTSLLTVISMLVILTGLGLAFWSYRNRKLSSL